MAKKILLVSVVLGVSSLFFIPATRQNTILIKSPFLNLYSFLANPQKWQQWRPDLRKYEAADSGGITIHNDSDAFTLNYRNLKLNVKRRENLFNIEEQNGEKTLSYAYSLLPVPDKMMDKTLISSEKSTSLAKYLLGKIWHDSLKDTHLYDLKAYLETDSLHYGFNIADGRVPAGSIIELKQKVLAKNKFLAANQMFVSLGQYIKSHQIKQVQPVIAQFLPANNDSLQVNVGLFIDKDVQLDKPFHYVSMPKGGLLYTIAYHGKFNKRYKVYMAGEQYLKDKDRNLIVLPFETYLDNKLPASDTDQVNIQVNFSSLP